MDEFTFPTVPGGQCKLAPFPPPWFLAALSEDEEDSGGAPWGGDEKMDMLWEDFNEELARVPPVCPLSPLTKGAGGLMTMTMMKEAAWLDDDGDSYGGVAEKGRRGRHMVVRRRRWSLLLMLRLLKKLFLVKKSRNQQRTTPI
jgi:hypothetical protein